MNNEIKRTPQWQLKKPPYEVGKDQFYYSNAKKDIDGWIDASMCKPLRYDMVYIKTSCRTKTGWWNGKFWEGLRVTEDEKILYWKIYTELRH